MLSYGHWGDPAYNSRLGATESGYLAIGGREAIIWAATEGLGEWIGGLRVAKAGSALEV